ncbi:hypothetical protein ACOMHN_065447 [Nucella lapillus]
MATATVVPCRVYLLWSVPGQERRGAAECICSGQFQVKRGEEPQSVSALVSSRSREARSRRVYLLWSVPGQERRGAAECICSGQFQVKRGEEPESTSSGGYVLLCRDRRRDHPAALAEEGDGLREWRRQQQ